MVLVIGSHMNRKEKNYDNIVDIIKGEHKIGGNIIQIFLGSSVKTTLSEKIKLSDIEIKEIKQCKKKYNMYIVIHGILTLNLCSPIEKRYLWNINNLIYDLELNEKINGLGVIIHMGIKKTKNFDLSYDIAELNFVKNIKNVLKQTSKLKSRIILETSCGEQNKIGGTLELFAQLYKKFNSITRKRIGICVDTAHIFAAGYNINSEDGMVKYWDDFDKLIGIENCTIIHLNDSKAEFCSCIDRHETIGKGNIFKDSASLKVLINIANKYNIPIVLETNSEFFKDEIELVKKLSGNNMKDIIIDIFEKMYEFYSKVGNEGNNKTAFRALSYKKVLNGLKSYKHPIYSIDDVKNINGIGERSLEKIDEIIKTGTLKILQNISSDPKIKAKQEFQNIFGIGPKIAKKIVDKYNILTIKDLKKAYKNNIINLTDKQIIGIKYKDDLLQKIPRNEIEKWDKLVKTSFNDVNINTVLVGSYRLGKKESGDIDIIIYSDKYDKQHMMDIFLKNFKKYILYVLSNGINKIMLLIKDKNGLVRHMDIIFINTKELPWWLLYFGSDVTFSRNIRAYASKKGYKLNEKGLFKKTKDNKYKRVNFNPKNEEEIFTYLGLDYVKPENRPLQLFRTTF